MVHRHWHSLRSFDRADMDYPGTTFWVESPNHAPRREALTVIVIHTTQGPAMDESGSVNKFRETRASIHYIVNRHGQIVQMVRDAEAANHVGGSIADSTNQGSIGIEHVNSSGMTPEPQQYLSSAKLVHWLCVRHGIDRTQTPSTSSSGIRGHHDTRSARGKICPGPDWDWDHYMGLVKGS